MFPGRTVNDGTGMIKLAAGSLAEADGRLVLTVEVNWPMILANAVARLYVVADANREPLLAQVLLIPDIVPPHVCLDVRVEDSGYLRAVVECGDGSLLEVKRWVWVVPPEP
jgi:predicted secreted protein